MSRWLWITVALPAAAFVAVGCGGSDKPAYCSDVSDLKQSVDDLKGVKVESGALPTLQADFKKVQTNADAVVSSAKNDFPSETSALKSSVTSLANSIQQLPPSPTAQQLAPLAQQANSVVTASNGLQSATSSACD